MNYSSILKADNPGAAKRRQQAIATLPPAPIHPPVNDDQENQDTAAQELMKRRSEAAVFVTAQEGTVAGFPCGAPNF